MGPFEMAERIVTTVYCAARSRGMLVTMLSEGAPAGETARTAVGALREMLSALGNLQQLLRSRSIGPKALAPLLPEVVHGAAPVLARLHTFWPTLGDSPLAECQQPLQKGLEQALGELQGTLGQAALRPLGAGSRLKVEAVVARALRELGGSLALFELVADLHPVHDAATQDQPTSERRWVDWVEALTLSRSGDQMQAPGCQLVQARIVIESQPGALPLGPRPALNFAAVLASWLAERSQTLLFVFESGAFEPGSPHAAAPGAGEAGPGSSLRSQLRVERGSGEQTGGPKAKDAKGGATIGLWVPPLLTATEACLAAVARARGLRLTLDRDRVLVNW